MLAEEIERIAKQTTYGGKQILYGADATNAATIKTIYGKGASATKAGVEKGSISFQVGANSGDTISLEVESFAWDTMISRVAADLKTTADLTKLGFGAATTSLFDFTQNNYASLAISTIDAMIANVDSQRSTLGAIQNRLESSTRVQSNVATNTSDARSRIRDTDFAEESANLSQQSIIQQAATSMLMQANARPQLGLSLLG